jgi:magnesium chelatase subunit D
VSAELLLPFTRDLETARWALEHQPTGGRTPLAHALRLAKDTLGVNAANALLVLLTDAKGNVPLPGGGDAWAQTLEAAACLAITPALVVDTEPGLIRANRAAEIARAMHAELLKLEELTGEQLALTLRGRKTRPHDRAALSEDGC